jgi:hypothetical protein
MANDAAMMSATNAPSRPMTPETSNTSEKQVNERKVFSEAVLVAAASALSYAVAYAYRSGFASYFELPPLLLTPTIGGILQAAASVGILLLTFWNILNGLWIFLPRTDSIIGRHVRRLLLMLLIMVLVLYSFLTSWWSWVIIATVLFFFGFGFFIFPLITQREIHGYENKLLAQEKVDAAGITLVDEARQRIGNKALSLIVASVVLLYFAHAVGNNAAKAQEDYFVVADTPDHVVAAMDDDTIVLVAYDPAAMTLKRAYAIRRLTSERVWLLEKKHIGRLQRPAPLKALAPSAPVQTAPSPTPSPTAMRTTTPTPTATPTVTGYTETSDDLR